MLAAPCQKLFETMVYHTDRARRLALTSPLLLPERVPVVFRLGCLTRRYLAAGFFLGERKALPAFRGGPLRVIWTLFSLGRFVGIARRAGRDPAFDQFVRFVEADPLERGEELGRQFALIARRTVFFQPFLRRPQRIDALLTSQFVALGEQCVNRLARRREPLDH